MKLFVLFQFCFSFVPNYINYRSLFFCELQFMPSFRVQRQSQDPLGLQRPGPCCSCNYDVFFWLSIETHFALACMPQCPLTWQRQRMVVHESIPPFLKF